MSARSEDLTADLLHDLAEDPSEATPQASPTGEPAPTAFVETRLFLTPATWKRPGLARNAGSYSVSAGPLQVRFGRRSR